MHLEQLGYVWEVAKCHSISIAAERLHITQPAVSQAIKNIEDIMGEEIFVRSKNGVFPTAFGEQLLPQVQEVIKAGERLYETAAQYHRPPDLAFTGYLRLSVNPALSYSIFQELLPSFSKRYPKVKLYIHECISDEVVADILDGSCDFGVVICDEEAIGKYRGYEQLRTQHLFTEKTYIITQVDSPLARKSSVSLNDIKDYPLSTTNFNGGDWRKGNLYSTAIDMNVVLTTDNIHLMQEYIERGSTIGVMINACLKRLTLGKNLVAVPLNTPLPCGVYCVYLKDNTRQYLFDILTEMIYEFS